jgi:hypothetical protein
MLADAGAKLALCSGAACLLALLAAPSALAAASWLAPSSLAVSEQASQVTGPQVSFDGEGNAIAVWSAGEGGSDVVQAAFRSAGGAWQAPVSLSSNGQSATEPHVAFDAQGDAVAVWDAYDGTSFNVQAAFRPAGGGWRTAVDLSAEEVPGADEPEVAFDAQGDAVAIWHRGGPTGGVVQSALMPVGGAWQAPVDIAASAVGFHPQVAFDRSGDELAAWEQYNGVDYTEWTAFKPAGGGWRSPVSISASGAEDARVAFDEKGDAFAVWRSWAEGFLSYHTMQAAFMAAGGAWRSPVDIAGAVDESDQPKNAAEPGLAVDDQGDAVAVWSWAFGAPVVQASFKSAGGAWQPPIDISKPDEDAEDPQVAFDARADALAVWEDREAGVVEAALKPAGGAWQASVELGRGNEPKVAFDGQGNAVAVWNGHDGIEGAGYAAAGPRLNDLSIPTAGVAGQPLTFSVAPLDVWSVPGETSWSFGDGTSSAGTSVTHVYAAAGSYEITLHSTDALGNVTSASYEVTIVSGSATATPSPAAPKPSSRPLTVSVGQSASSWREHGKSPVGTTFLVSLSERAVVNFSFARHVRGRTLAHQCATHAPKRVRGEVCSRAIPAGGFSFLGHDGTNRAVFRGRIARADQLEPGRYTATITATNSAGEHSRAESLNFTVVD